MPNLAPDDPRHGGSGHAYANLGCRCDKCRRVNTARVARRRAERIHELPPADSHGKESTYGNWGCRCRKCYATHQVVEASKRARRKARATADPSP